MCLTELVELNHCILDIGQQTTEQFVCVVLQVSLKHGVQPPENKFMTLNLNETFFVKTAALQSVEVSMVTYTFAGLMYSNTLLWNRMKCYNFTQLGTKDKKHFSDHWRSKAFLLTGRQDNQPFLGPMTKCFPLFSQTSQKEQHLNLWLLRLLPVTGHHI